jgi:hypothetical protein
MTVTKYSGNTKAIVVGALTAAILDFAILRRWGLDRRAKNPSKFELQAMFLPFAVLFSGIATLNLTLRSGE